MQLIPPLGQNVSDLSLTLVGLCIASNTMGAYSEAWKRVRTFLL